MESVKRIHDMMVDSEKLAAARHLELRFRLWPPVLMALIVGLLFQAANTPKDLHWMLAVAAYAPSMLAIAVLLSSLRMIRRLADEIDAATTLRELPERNDPEVATVPVQADAPVGRPRVPRSRRRRSR